MKATYDSIPALVQREGSRLRIFHSFEAVTVTVTDKDVPRTNYVGESVDIDGFSDYPSIVSAIFRDRYPDAVKDAILLNRELVRDTPTHEKASKYIAEYEAMQAFRLQAKQTATDVIAAL